MTEVSDNPHRSSRRGTAARILAYLSLAIAGLLIGYGLDRNLSEKARVDAEHYQTEKAQIAATKIRAFLLNATQLSETLKVMVEQYNGGGERQIEEYLDRILESAPDDLIYGVGVWFEPYQFKAKKQYFGPYAHRSPRVGSRILTYEWSTPAYDFPNQEWYREGIASGGTPAFTEPYFDNGTVYMTLAVSFNDRKTGKVKGVITIDMILPQLQKLVDTVNDRSRDVIFIVGKEGKLLAHPDVKSLLEKSKGQKKYGNVQSILDIPPKLFLSGHLTAKVYQTQMKENGWKIVVASPQSTILAGYLDQRNLIITSIVVYEIVLLLLFLIISFFNEGMRRLKERSFLAITAERNQIKAIVDNVQFGLMRIDRNGRIQFGHSQSCWSLLSLDSSTELGHPPFWKFLSLSSRETAHLESVFDQVFEVPFLALEMAQQIPSQFTVRGRVLSFRYYPIMQGEDVESLLVSIADISRSRSTEIENESNKTLIRILRNKDRFITLINEIYQTDETLLSPTSWQALENLAAMRNIRGIVHTWKGDLATFGLHETVNFVHTIEDSLHESLTLAQSRELTHILKTMIGDYLQANYSILKITPDRSGEKQISVSESALLKLRDEISLLARDRLSGQLIQAFIDRHAVEKGEDILAYLSIAAQEIARRQDKELKIETKGAELTFPRQYSAIFISLIHVIRNAVDHGLEKTKDRGTKSPQGKIEIEFTESDQGYKIIISDDGRGIDIDKLRKVVLAKGICNDAEWLKLGPERQLRFIFSGTISTRSHVSLLSGRGIGLDGVLSSVESQGGRINVGSQLGFGTRIEIILPKALSEPLSA